MAREITIEVTASSAAPIDEVFAVLADVQRWHEWTRFSASELERPGAPEPDGVGAIRRFRAGPITTREEVVRFERPAGLSYQVLSGLPVRDHRADVVLSPAAGGGTDIAWTTRCRPALPGTGPALRWFLRRVVTEVAERLAARAATGPLR